MYKPTISLVAAIGKNRELGNSKANNLLWYISEDFKHFKKVTTGHPIIMGRKTYESIGRPLPNRLNIIVTRNKDFSAQGCKVVASIDDAIKLAKNSVIASDQREQGNLINADDKTGVKSSSDASARLLGHDRNDLEIMIIGGGQIFEETIKLADKIYLTIIDAEFPKADVFFPDYSEFKKVLSKKNNDNSEYKFSFLELAR